jgi:adenylate cyclase
MPGPLQIRVIDRQQVVYSHEFPGVVELGRQTDGLEDLYTCRPLPNNSWRAVIARLDEDTLSRRHALLEPLDHGRVRLTNLSAKVPLLLADGQHLTAGSSRELFLPLVFTAGRRTVYVEGVERPEPALRSLPAGTVSPGRLSIASRFPTLPTTDSVQTEALVRWLQTSMAVLQSAASSSDFFQKAAQAIVTIVGCDIGRVLLLEDGQWKTLVVHRADETETSEPSPPSLNVLQRLANEKRTFWLALQPSETLPGSLMGVESIVAAPILDRAEEVIGAVYGERREDSGSPLRARITEVDAVLVELLASGVATGIARIEQEKAALEADVRFGQFFTRELSRQLALQPDLLEGRDAEVSVLFCDIRGFSRISERLGPARTVEWVSDVLGVLSDCVLEQCGVLVDYIGDELMAMWGAPEQQRDHASRACRAALAMLEQIPDLNQRWQSVLGEPIALGIGINSGWARVGNTGSRHKFKYGPLGHPVNLASRVQGATKYFRSALLVTEFTRAHLNEDFDTRRLCKVRVVNIGQPVDLYEVVPQRPPGWLSTRERYEQALAEFEQGRFRSAALLLGPLLGEQPDDGPALVLLARAVNSLVEGPEDFDPVWELPGK